MDWVDCFKCGKSFLKDKRHINENKKLGHNFYCSIQCQILTRLKKVEFICTNPLCRKKFKKQPSDISQNNYCSRRCAVTINNTKRPKRIAIIRNCHNCGSKLLNFRKYCSVECKSNALTISKEEVISRIKRSYKKHGRIPVKKEMWGIYKPARKYFGTWNNAIEASGFNPNPIMFANHHIANDGHICDSLAEKLIDDYLSERKVTHEREVSYPEGKYTFDFKIDNRLIEYFGLAGEHERYDELRRIKQEIVKRHKLQIIEIYPKDLYPQSRLDKILQV